MHQYLWIAHLAVAATVGWGGLTWLVTTVSPQTGLARLGFIFALAAGLYATTAMLAYAVCLLLWPTAPRIAVRTFSQRQGVLWSALLSSMALLRLGGEMSALTVGFALALFATAQYSQLRQAG